MELSAPPVVRSKEDIALDLLKFVAAHTSLGRSSTNAPGFGVASTPKAEDQAASILELYTRCRAVVEAPAATPAATTTAPAK